jgi:hypothetical protein
MFALVRCRPKISNRGSLLLGHKTQQQIEWHSNRSNEISFFKNCLVWEPSFEYSIAEE